MYEFMTVKMIADKAMDYAEFPVAAGEEFYATPDDAGYFEKHGRAHRAPEDKPAPEPVAVVEEPPSPRRGRPRKADVPAEPAASEAATDQAPQAEPEAEAPAAAPETDPQQ